MYMSLHFVWEEVALQDASNIPAWSWDFQHGSCESITKQIGSLISKRDAMQGNVTPFSHYDTANRPLPVHKHSY